MTEPIHCATYGRDCHRRPQQPRRQSQQPRARETTKDGGEGSRRDGRDRDSGDDGPEGCYYVPRRDGSSGRSRPPSRSRSTHSRGADPPASATSGGGRARSRSGSVDGRSRRGGAVRWYAQTRPYTQTAGPPGSGGSTFPSAAGGGGGRSLALNFTTPTLSPPRSRLRSSCDCSPAPRHRSRTPPRSCRGSMSPSQTTAETTTTRESSSASPPLGRSQSWDGRTRHYDRNRLKSHSHSSSRSRPARATTPPKLSRQLAGFDFLSSNKNAAAAVAAENGASDGGRGRGIGGRLGNRGRCRGRSLGRLRKKIAGSSNGKDKAGGKYSKAGNNKSSPSKFKRRMKKVLPLVPVVTGNSCRKYGERGVRMKRLQNSEDAVNGDAKEEQGRKEERDEDGSTTYYSDDECSYSSRSGASSYYSSDDEGEKHGEEERGTDFSDEEDSSDNASSYSEGENDEVYYGISSDDRSKDRDGGHPSEGEGSVASSYVSGGSSVSSTSSRRRDVQHYQSSRNGGRRDIMGREDSRSRSRISSRRGNVWCNESSRERQYRINGRYSRSRSRSISRRGSVGCNESSKECGDKISGGDNRSRRWSSSRRGSVRCSESPRECRDIISGGDSRSRSRSSSRRGSVPCSGSPRERRDIINGEDRSSSSSSRLRSSQRQLVELSEENETLRAHVVALRADFEAMLRQMNSIEERQHHLDGCGDSIATDDDSRVSFCIQRIEGIKSRAVEKLHERRRRRRKQDANGLEAQKEVDRVTKAYQDRIEDLLCENEQLYHKIVSLSKEREEITEEVCALHCCSLNNADDNISNSDVVHDRGLLTDEGMAKIHNERMDDIASLVPDIGKRDPKEDVDEKKMGKDIMGLVSKILSQRVTPSNVNRDPPRQDIKKGEEGVVKENTSGQHMPTVDDLKAKSESFIFNDKSKSADQEDEHRIFNRRKSQFSDQNAESVSVSTAFSNSTYDESYVGEPYIVNEKNTSSNSLFDGISPSNIVLNGQGNDEGNGDDDASSLEIIYEYDGNGSEVGSVLSYPLRWRRASKHSAYRDHGDEIHDDYSKTYKYEKGEEGCNSNQESKSTSDHGSKSTGRSFLEEVEHPPHGYHRYSSSSSRYSSSEEKGVGVRRRGSHRSKSFHSPSTTRHPQHSSSASRQDRRCKSFHFHCSAAVMAKQEKLLRARGHDDGVSVASEEIHDSKSQACESARALDDVNQDQEDQLVHAIESHLSGTVVMKSHHPVNTPSTSCASVSAGSTEDTCPSFSGESTKERKGICITVVGRASPFISFPSSPAHTYVTFFQATLSKSQVDAVLEEQFQVTRETLEDSVATQRLTNCSKARRKKYQGEFNEEGERHGYGIYTSRNGNEYRGEWHEDKREGLGVVKIGNGDVFEGQFENNLKNGIGVYHFCDGECDLSRYNNDARVGDSVRFSKDRRQAFLLSEDSGSEAISLEEAAQAAKEMGTIVAF